MKKHLANMITGSRILGSALLLLLPFPSRAFYILYSLCGFSDMIDGTIARKTNAAGGFGSRLDTAADFVFLAVCATKLLPTIRLPAFLWIWIATIAMIKLCNMVFGFSCRGTRLDTHTVLNKVTGLTLFLLPFTLPFIAPTYSFAAVCLIATVAAIKEGYDTFKGRKNN